jgi:hypothetical protein
MLAATPVARMEQSDIRIWGRSKNTALYFYSDPKSQPNSGCTSNLQRVGKKEGAR